MIKSVSKVPPGFREITEASGFAAANGPWFEKVEGRRVWRGFLPGPQHANALGIVEYPLNKIVL